MPSTPRTASSSPTAVIAPTLCATWGSAAGTTAFRSASPPSQAATAKWSISPAPVRARLVLDQQALLVTAHYLVVDEWSVVPLFRDLDTAYSARRNGVTPEIAPQCSNERAVCDG